MNGNDFWEVEYLSNEANVTDDCTFIDPEDALPEEVFPVFKDQKTLLVPRLQSMKNYIAFHYKRTLMKRLTMMLTEKVLNSNCAYSSLPVVTELELGKMEFWEIPKRTVIAHINVQSRIDYNGRKNVRRNYIVVMEFDFDEKIGLTSVTFHDCNERFDYSNCWKLTEHLIPIFTKQEIEEHAENLLLTANYDGWCNQLHNTPWILAEKLGLSVEKLRLHNYGRTKSLLFLKNGTITVDILDESNQVVGTVRKTIAADTIVINSNVVPEDYSQLEIYHECIHYEWHYLFFILQDMHNNDLREIKKVRKVQIVHKKKSDPLSWIEFQASQASFAVWMPQKFMTQAIRKEMAKQNVYDTHPGQKYDAVCRLIAKEYNIPKYRVRARVIKLGHIEARGALNYLDHHYVEPFSFDRENGSGNYTFFITRKQISDLYESNDGFRELIDSQKFIFIDGHLVLNDPTLYTMTSHGPRLTSEVRAHVDQYCLRFIDVYEQDEIYAYRHGRLNSDEEYNKHYLYFPPMVYTEKHPQPSEQEQVLLNMKYAVSLPGSFPGMLVKLMKDCHVTTEELSARTGLSDRLISSLRNDVCVSYSLDVVMAIIIGLHIPPWVSFTLLETAGISLNRNPAMLPYSNIINCMYMDDMDTIQEHLVKIGLKRFQLEDPAEAVA